MITVDIQNISSAQEQQLIDQIIDMETKRKVSKVERAKQFDIMTACRIDGEFVLVSGHDVPSDITEQLEKA